MANLETSNIFIDTEAFDDANLKFASTALKELVRLVQAKFANVFLTSVTEAEIRSHIAEKIHEASARLKKFRKEGRVLRNIPSCASIFADLDEAAAIAELQAQFDSFLANAKVSIISLDGIEAQTVFDDYFQKKPPFGDGKKKHEFPDAFAQQVLKKWCETNEQSMYVVSRDDDWQSAAKPLIPMASLEEFIDLALKDQYAELSAKVLSLYSKNLVKVDKAIREAFENSGFYTADVDGDVNGVVITNLKLSDPLVLEVEDESATISVSVDLDYLADVSYLDDSGGIWDSEDHEWSYRPTKYEEVEESETFEAELYVEFAADSEDIFEVNCTIGGDFRVTVLPTDYELK